MEFKVIVDAKARATAGSGACSAGSGTGSTDGTPGPEGRMGSVFSSGGLLLPSALWSASKTSVASEARGSCRTNLL